METILLLINGDSMVDQLGVVPVVVGPLTTLLAMLPAILVAVGGVLASLLKPTALKRAGLMLWAQKLIVVPIILVVAGAVWGLGQVMQPALEDVAGLEAGAMEWPLFRGSLNRVGYVPNEFEDPAHGGMHWSFSDGDVKAFYSSPSLVGNRVYASSSNMAANRGAVLSIDADTGKTVWAYRENYRPTFSSPAIYGRYLAVGEGLHATKDARIFCFDWQESEKQRKGVKLWEFRTASHVESSPCIAELPPEKESEKKGDAVEGAAAAADVRVFIGAGDDGVYCIAAEPDEQGNARVLWHLEGGAQYADCETSPIYLDGKVYFGVGLHDKKTGTGGQALVCVDAHSGKELWRISTPAPVFSAPSIYDGKIYFGMGNGDFVFTAEALRSDLEKRMREAEKSEEEIEAAVKAFPLTGEVWCVDLETRKVDWKFTVGRTVLGTVAVDGKNVYFGSRDGKVYKLSMAGKLERTFKAHRPVLSSVSVGKEMVYAVTDTGQFYGLDKERLEKVWEVALGNTFSSPAVGRGHVFIGSDLNGLMALGRPGREKLPPVWSGALGGVGRGGNIDGSVLPSRSHEQWAYSEPYFADVAGEVAAEDADDEADDTEEVEVAITSPMANISDVYYVGYSQGERHGLMSLRASQGKQLLSPTAKWLAVSKNAVWQSPAATSSGVYFVDGRAGDQGRALHAIDPESGEERWSYPIADGADGRIEISSGVLYVQDQADGLSAIDISVEGDSPKVLWQRKTGAIRGDVFRFNDFVLLSLADEKAAVALDALTGVEVWRQELTGAAGTGPLVIDDRVWVGQADGLVGYPLIEGDKRRVLRADDAGSLTGRLIKEDDRIISTTEAGELSIVRIVEEQVSAPASADKDKDKGKQSAGDDAEPVTVSAEPGSSDSAEDEASEAMVSRITLEVKRVKGLKPGTLPLVTRSGALLYVSNRGIQRYDFANGRSRVWMQIPSVWFGEVTTPLVMVDSQVFFSSEKRGLVCTAKPQK